MRAASVMSTEARHTCPRVYSEGPGRRPSRVIETLFVTMPKCRGFVLCIIRLRYALPIITPHNTGRMRPIVTDVPSSVCVLDSMVSCTKTDEPIEIPLFIGGQTCSGPRYHVAHGAHAHWRHLANTIDRYVWRRRCRTSLPLLQQLIRFGSVRRWTDKCVTVDGQRQLQ